MNRGQASVNVWPSIVILAVLTSAVSIVLASGDGGVVFIGGEAVRTGPIPVWLVELLYSPDGWVLPAVAAVAGTVLLVAYAGYRNHGIDEEVKREALSNTTIVVSMGGLTVVLASTGLVPYWAAVPLGSFFGFVGGLYTQEWLGL